MEDAAHMEHTRQERGNFSPEYSFVSGYDRSCSGWINCIDASRTEIATFVRFPWDYPGSEPIPFDAAKRFQAAPASN